jgi:porphobilinogen synthase
MTDLITRPRRLRKSASLRAMFEETTLSLNDLVLPIFVEEEIDDYKAISAMPGVMRIPEKHLAREIERIARAGIRSVMTFGISHHTDATGSDAWQENGLVARMSRIAKDAVPEMIVMSDTCFCEYTSHGHCGVLCDHGVDNDATLINLGKQAVVAAAAGADFIAPPPQWTVRCRRFARRWTPLALPTPPSCPIPPNSRHHSTARSVKRQVQR